MKLTLVIHIIKDFFQTAVRKQIIYLTAALCANILRIQSIKDWNFRLNISNFVNRNKIDTDFKLRYR